MASLTVYPSTNGNFCFDGVPPWSNVHDHATADTAFSTTDTDDYIQCSQSFTVQRDGFVFDTSSLTAGATVTAAVFSIYINSHNSGNGDSMSLVLFTPTSFTSLATGDYDQSHWGTAAIATDKAISGLSNGAYYDYTITDLSSISKTSWTGLGLRHALDRTNTSPGSGTNNVNFGMLSNATQGKRPVLAITYTPASTFTKNIIKNQSVGRSNSY